MGRERNPPLDAGPRADDFLYCLIALRPPLGVEDTAHFVRTGDHRSTVTTHVDASMNTKFPSP